MDCGIPTTNSGRTNDPDFRFEIYRDWKSIYRRYPNYDREEFCKEKGLSPDELGEIMREFQSYDPDGSRWGK